MNLANLKETLTHKYGPLPGYAWAGIGAGLIVAVGLLRGKKGSATDTGAVTLTPVSDGSLGMDGSGGGGGGFDPSAGLIDGGTLLPTQTIAQSDGGSSGGSAGLAVPAPASTYPSTTPGSPAAPLIVAGLDPAIAFAIQNGNPPLNSAPTPGPSGNGGSGGGSTSPAVAGISAGVSHAEFVAKAAANKADPGPHTSGL